MTWILASLAMLAAGSTVPALVGAWRPRAALRLALFCAWAGAALGIVPAVSAMLGSAPWERALGWQAPLGAFTLGLDPLTGFFLAPILLVPALASLAGHAQLTREIGRRRVLMSACFFNALTASMALVVLARDAAFFLVAWELMSLTSYFLVTYEDDSAEVQQAGFVYLVATHIGTAFLLVFFALLAAGTGSLAFASFQAPAPAAIASFPLLLLALLGFGTKAGIAPLHVWLPRAHPAAPSHISAVMSGIMIKTGIYGLLRALSFLGPPEPAWGYLMLALGAISAVGGVLFALAQHDLKRMLAYHSVENIGIICLGIGVGLLGRSYHEPALEALGFAGALLHVWNHAAFKSLLFLSAGAVVHSTRERAFDRLGGLLRRMPWSGTLFLVGSVAICGLPPFNGFVSEWLIYWGAFGSAAHLPSEPVVACVAAATALALVGALAVACFSKAFGVTFLGQPRGPACARGHDPDRGARWAMSALALICAAIGLAPPLAVAACRAAALSLAEPGGGAQWLGSAPLHTLGSAASQALDRAAGAGAHVAAFAISLVLAVGALFALREQLLMRRSVVLQPTWGCGYERPGPRMQYTGSSFAQPLLDLFRGMVSPTVHREPVKGFFPRRASLDSHAEDPAERRLFRPAFSSLPALLARFRWMQRVPVQVQLLYILIGLVVLLVLGLRGLT